MRVHQYFYWVVMHIPNEAENGVCEALSLVFQQDGKLPAITCDNAKEMILSELNRNFKVASFHLRQTKQLTQWSNTAKREIQKMKKGFGKN